MNPIVMAEGCAQAQRQLPRPAWRGGRGWREPFSRFHGGESGGKIKICWTTPLTPTLFPPSGARGRSRPLPKPMAFVRSPRPTPCTARRSCAFPWTALQAINYRGNLVIPRVVAESMQRVDSAYCDFAQHDTLRSAQNDDSGND